MSYYEPREPEFTDAEWDRAREHLADQWTDDGYTRAEAYAHIDDLMIADQCVQDRDDAAATAADQQWHLDRDEGRI